MNLNLDPDTINNILLTLTVVFGALFAVSEALDEIPFIRGNSIHRAIYNMLRKLAGK